MRVGTVLSLPGAALAELAGHSFDFAWIDLEHGALEVSDAQTMAIGLAASGCEAHVRLPATVPERLAAVIDAGVDGIVLPRAEHPDEVRELVSRVRYPPRGRRGFGPRRAGGYGRRSPEPHVALTIQVESPEGVSAARILAAVDGVDAVVVGCGDLSLGLDVAHDLTSPRLRDAVASVAGAAAAAGVRFGVAASGDTAAVSALAAGADLIVYSADTRLYSAAADAAARAVEAVDV